MKYCFKMVFIICVSALSSSVVVLSEGNATSTTQKETMNDSYQTIASRLEAFQNAHNIDELIQIGKDIECLPIVQKTDFATWTEQRRSKLKLWLTALDKIDRMMDPKFDPDDAPLKNIAPSSSAYDSGIAPSAIKDLKVREQYEQAIKANAEKAERYRFQKKLRKLDRDWSSKVSAYIKSQYTSDVRDINEIDALIDMHLADSPRKKQLRKDFLGVRPKRR